MKRKDKYVLGIGALLAVTAVILQFYLIVVNRTAGISETVMRFFSFFTILTNSLVAIYFCTRAFFRSSKLSAFFGRSSVVTAIAVYITLVGAVYQFILRNTWHPTGLQLIVDELLHSVIPAYFVLYWIFFVSMQSVSWKSIAFWMIYPIVYFVLIILRGELSGFYPYPFTDVSGLGLEKVLVNAGMIVAAFAFLSAMFILMARSRAKRNLAKATREEVS